MWSWFIPASGKNIYINDTIFPISQQRKTYLLCWRIAALSRDGLGPERTSSAHAVGPHSPFSRQLLRQASWQLGQRCRLAEFDLVQAFEAALVAVSIVVGSGCWGLDLARQGRHILRLGRLDWLRLVYSERYRVLVSVAVAAVVVVRRRRGSGRSLLPPDPVDSTGCSYCAGKNGEDDEGLIGLGLSRELI